MGILGIKNRTENWKTAQHFAPFFWDEDARVRLAQKLGEPNGTNAKEVHVELFWKGFRDYTHKQKTTPDKVASIYMTKFHDLRQSIEDYGSRHPNHRLQLQAHNYDASPNNRSTLLGNLEGTEIDIAVETNDCLMIGEAKDESGLDTDATYILVHQLVREYVMARILLELVGSQKKVVPFLVRPSPSGSEQAQVEFMIAHYGMRRTNVLTWEDIEALWPEHLRRKRDAPFQ